MNNFINKLTKFMYGRYGIDELYYFLLIICLIIIILNIFIKSSILTLIEFIILILATFRYLSKNISKRKKENKRYLYIKDKIINYFKYQKRKYNDRNTHMYKKCPKCKQKIRLPLKKGKHTVKCPNCSHKFEVKCSKDEKVKVEMTKYSGGTDLIALTQYSPNVDFIYTMIENMSSIAEMMSPINSKIAPIIGMSKITMKNPKAIESINPI